MDAQPLRESSRWEPVRVLFVEDSPDDLELILRELRKAKMDVLPDVVATKEDFLKSLSTAPHDVIVADYQLVGWTGMEALSLMRDNAKDIPFVLVTGVLGEEIAVDCIRRGVSDYVLKDHLARLPIAISRSINEVRQKEQEKQADLKLRESENMFRTLAETIHSAILVYLGTKCRYANREAEIITGYTREQLLAMSSLDIIHPDSRDEVIQMGFSAGGTDALPRHREAKIITQSGETKWLDMTSSVVDIEGKRGRLITAFDITERKKVHEEVRRLVTIDPLTGLANYRHLMHAFDSELGRSMRTGRPFSFVLLDLDGLKKINDLHGHVVGSRAICRVGDVLRTQCRSVDIAARYGGDEFAVILPETSAQDAKYLANRIAGSIKLDREEPAISVSFGLAAFPNDGNNFKDVLRAADHGLYAMKGQSNGSRALQPSS